MKKFYAWLLDVAVKVRDRAIAQRLKDNERFRKRMAELEETIAELEELVGE